MVGWDLEMFEVTRTDFVERQDLLAEMDLELPVPKGATKDCRCRKDQEKTMRFPLIFSRLLKFARPLWLIEYWL